MVTQVYGTLHGQQVNFSREGEEWTFFVPRLESGEYVMDIMADDEAGNAAYMATILFAVSTDRLCVNVHTEKRVTSVCDSGITTSSKILKCRALVVENGFIAVAKMVKYSAAVVRCELCGRW